MNILKDIRKATEGYNSIQLLSYLLNERFRDQVVVTATLKSPSVVTLKLISDINPATPVVFCQPMLVFPESETYRAEIVEQLGLSNFTVLSPKTTIKGNKNFELCERLWSDRPGGGKNRETVQLNDALANYRCWIKAAYHDSSSRSLTNQIEYYAGMVIVDPLYKQTTKEVDQLMETYGLPYHPRIRHRKKRVPPRDGPAIGAHFG